MDVLAVKGNFHYEFTEKELIVISPPRSTASINLDITGLVKDDSGAPVAGCLVRIAGSDRGTITTIDGRYVLEDVPVDATLEFSFMGMESRSLPVDKRTVIDVVMTKSLIEVGEVVVIGYGAVKRSDLTGSVVSVDAEAFEKSPSYSLDQALKGRAAGVRVMRNSNDPGSRVEINIRGGNSMIASNHPLYVVDGFPITGGLDYLNPSDIQSIDILKDASATAIYGSRGANGVVIVSTHQADKNNEKGVVSFSSMMGVQTIARQYDMLDVRQYAIVSNEWLKNDGLQPWFDLDVVENQGTNWQNLIMQNAIVQDHSIGFASSTPKTQYSISGNYFSQDGIVKGTSVDRGSIRVNINSEVKKWLKISFNANLSRRTKHIQNVDNGVLGNNVFSGALASPPTLKPYNDEGLINQVHAYYPFTSPDITNPLLFLQNKNITKRNSAIGNIALDFKILPELTFKTLLGLEYEMFLNEQYTPIIYDMDFGYASEQAYQRNSFLNENTLTYSKTFGDHSFNVVGGFTYQNYMTRNHTISVNKFTSNITENYNLGAAENINPPSSSYSDWVMASFLGRLNYIFKNRYLFTVSFRADGSSRFGDNNKWGYFPSGAFAWRLSEENFMKHQNVISNLKFRVSYGITGNTALSPYQTLNRLSTVRFQFGSDGEVVGLVPSAIANKSLRWESTAQFDAGVDFGILNNRVSFTLDFYRKHTRDLLASSPIPWSTGFRTIMKNVGEIENRGVELSVFAEPVRTRNVQWNLSGHISRNVNKVLKLENGSDLIGGSVLFSSTNIAREGYPLGVFFGYKEEGLDASGFIRYRDLKEDGIINSDDRVILGSPYPDFVYGLTSDLTYRDFNLNIFVEGVHGNELLWETAGSHLNSFQKGTNQFADLFGNYWTAENRNQEAKYPKISKDSNFMSSDRFIKDGSYLRIKSVTLTWNLPTERWKIEWLSDAQIYVTATNLLTITAYPGLDPDVNTRGSDSDVISSRLMIGVDASAYPLARTYSAGIRLKF
jgi:TonB-linked SusC/RagA family outer membrane protein